MHPERTPGIPKNISERVNPLEVKRRISPKLVVLASILGGIGLVVAACENTADDSSISYKIVEGVGKVDPNCELFLDRLTVTFGGGVINDQGELTDETIRNILDRFEAERIAPDLIFGEGVWHLGVEPKNRLPLKEALDEQVESGKVVLVEEVPTIIIPEEKEKECAKLPIQPPQ